MHREDQRRGPPGGAGDTQAVPPVVEERKPDEDLLPEATAAVTAASDQKLDPQALRGVLPLLRAFATGERTSIAEADRMAIAACGDCRHARSRVCY